MNLRRTMAIALSALLVTVLWGFGPPPARAIDASKIPTYFGPAPNWALSPLPKVDPQTGKITGGIRKFVDTLPLVGATGANNLGNYLPVAVPDTTTYPGADYYEIGLVQYRQQMHTDLPKTLLRGYVQLGTSVVPGNVPLSNARLDGSGEDAISGFSGVTPPNYLGPIIVAKKDRPVRIVFRNLLPTGSGGDLFLPVDSSMMGSGHGLMDEPYNPAPVAGGDVFDEVRNPMCTESPKPDMCFKDNRGTLHLHGGITPWISDGTPHQWITPAGENTDWPKGVSVKNVPDMPDPGAGAMTFFYTNQQSARLMFYHDHSWGITRLNVYAGEAAGYIITDDTEKKLVDNGIIPGDSSTIPLIIQDRTFVPEDKQLYGDLTDPANPVYGQDPTWDKTRWGGFGNLWYHHVYMPAQNPGDVGGMSAYGRWMYGPWFWPPADAKYGPIANPRYQMDPATDFETPLKVACDIDDPSTWQYPVEPFCEPAEIPGTPNISAGMEQFNDTPIVNGTAYPKLTVEPKPYRLRILNAANDRFFNLQWYVADATGTEVALKASELAAAQEDPTVFPTPDTAVSPAGPSWIQIGTEGGFLPAPVVIPNQPTTWITDPTRFDVGNVDKHSLLVAPAERADVIVDFSQFAGKTLILYNDAPAAFPARVASYDYYTGAPDLSPNGAPGILPGYGPNTRTVMKITVSEGTGSAFNLTALEQAFQHKADGSGVFESGQHPIIVGQAAYNSAYGTSFAKNSYCNSPMRPTNKCDGMARINDQGGQFFGFNTLFSPTTKVQIPLEPKAIHDEMNASTFDEFGRMQANLGIEAVPATPGLTNVNLMSYVFPPTEVIDGSNLPSSTKVTPISVMSDGTQIWKITHNGVDTHPIHFHLYDVQVLNRVTWDNIVIPPDANEIGWKDTVRVSPLEDTIVALRPVIPVLPFDLPNSIRLLNPMLKDGAPIALASVADAVGVGIPPSNPAGEPVDIYNHKVNFGAEYVWHCHILSHEEMDMMRPVAVALPPVAPANLTVTASGTGASSQLILSWADKSLSETAFEIQRAASASGSWTTLATVESSTGPSNTETISYTYPIGSDTTPYLYRVRAINVVGDTHDYADPNVNEIVSGGFPTVTARSTFTNSVIWPPPPTLQKLAWVNVPASSKTTTIFVAWAPASVSGVTYVVQAATDPDFATVTGEQSTTNTSYTFTGISNGTYYFRVMAIKAGYIDSTWATGANACVAVSAPIGAPSHVWVRSFSSTGQPRVTYVASVTPGASYIIEESIDPTFPPAVTTQAYAGTSLDVTLNGRTNGTYYYRVKAVKAGFTDSAWANGPNGCVVQLPVVGSPSNVWVRASSSVGQPRVTYVASATAGATYVIEESTDPGFAPAVTQQVYSGPLLDVTFNGRFNGTYYYRVKAVKAGYTDSRWVNGPNGCVVKSAPIGAPSYVWVRPSTSVGQPRITYVASVTAGATYVVEESTDPTFSPEATSVAYTGSLLDITLTGRTPATYYYRVKAVKTGYTDSAWAVGPNGCVVIAAP